MLQQSLYNSLLLNQVFAQEFSGKYCETHTENMRGSYILGVTALLDLRLTEID